MKAVREVEVEALSDHMCRTWLMSRIGAFSARFTSATRGLVRELASRIGSVGSESMFPKEIQQMVSSERSIVVGAASEEDNSRVGLVD